MDSPLDPNLANDVKAVLAEAPQPIRDFFANRKLDPVTQNLMHKYQLHVDQGAILERELILLLLGLEDPQEFSNALKEEGGMPEQLVTNIMLDVNAQIFIPLRDQLRRQGSEPEAPAPQPARAQPPTPKPVSPQPPAYGMRQAPVPTPAPRPPSLNRLAQSAPARVPQPTPRPTPQPAPQRAGLAAAIERATQAAPAPQPPAPLAPSQPTPEPMKEVVRSAPVSLQQPAPPKVRPYSVDPYRESVDGEQ